MSSLYTIQQATPQYVNVSSGFADSTGLFPTIGLALVVILVIVGLMSSARFYRWVLGASGHLARSFVYAIKGVATAAVIAVFAGPIYLFATLDTGTKSMVYRAIGLLIVGYAGLVVLGYIGERAWNRINSQHEAVTGDSLAASFREESQE